MKYVLGLMGDPHQKRDNIDETKRLLAWFSSECDARRATPFFMGDLFDGFGVVSLDVLSSWNQWCSSRVIDPEDFAAWSLVGNHDGDHQLRQNVLSVLQGLRVVDRPYSISKVVGALPFYRDNAEFVRQALHLHSLGARVILCHQEFKGCQLDNGYYSPNGVDPDQFPAGLMFVSGHIHRRSIMEKNGDVRMYYVGTPRHLTRSDIGETKGVTFMHVDEAKAGTPEFITFEFVKTPEEVAEPFRHYVITPETADQKIEGSRTYVDVRGPKDFVRKAVAKLPEGAKVRSFPDAEKRQTDVKESDGIPKAFARYADSFFKNRQLDDKTKEAVLAKVYETCPSLRG